jgi:dGTPase
MDLNKLYSATRTGIHSTSTNTDPRTEYQRDYDRIIFSASFRRLQNKTQVFPLPGSVFVHNRLTHSLEVSSVGRSLGRLAGDFLVKKYGGELTDESKEFYNHNLYNVIAAACLCHDIGNPAFGHSGEDAISNYFKRNEAQLKPLFTDAQWADFVNFEGNANAIRILTQQQNGKSEGGMKLTHTTLATIAKYPCESIASKKGILHRKKFGFFQSEKETFSLIAENTGMVKESDYPMIYLRHPFVRLVEAADDICYNVIDLEDSQRLGIIDHNTCTDIMLRLLDDLLPDRKQRNREILGTMPDKNERISFLRATCISALITRSQKVFEQYTDDIISGKMAKPILDIIAEDCPAIDEIYQYSIENIYNYRGVVEIENAGYTIMYELLSHFIPPTLMEKENRAKSDQKALKLIPQQYIYEGQPVYNRVMGVLDYVSGMTDNYATDMYRKLKSIDIGINF